jgi:hypothetical protein
MKTSELTGATLDWAVAKAEGYFDMAQCEGYFDRDMAVIRDGEVSVHYFPSWKPSKDWARGGPIIEREDINVDRLTRSEVTESGSEIYRKDGWTAFTTVSAYWITPIRQYGPTPLTAAMRCYVASKLGEEVEVPEELHSAL